MTCQYYLPDIIHAGTPAGSLANLLNGRKKHANQDPDNRDYNKQFH